MEQLYWDIERWLAWAVDSIPMWILGALSVLFTLMVVRDVVKARRERKKRLLF